MLNVTTRAMSEPERAATLQVLERTRKQGSAWHFAARPLVLGCTLLALGLTGLLAISSGGRLASGVGTAPLQQAGVLAAAALALSGVLMAGYGVARLMLGSLMAGRVREVSQQTFALINAELIAGQVEQIEATLSAASPVGGMASGRAWIARAGDHLLAIDGADFASHGERGPSVLLRSIQLVVLPTSRRVLSARSEGMPLAEGRAIAADAVPDFARGYRPLRVDHFPESVRADLP